MMTSILPLNLGGLTIDQYSMNKGPTPFSIGRLLKVRKTYKSLTPFFLRDFGTASEKYPIYSLGKCGVLHNTRDTILAR